MYKHRVRHNTKEEQERDTEKGRRCEREREADNMEP